MDRGGFKPKNKASSICSVEIGLLTPWIKRHSLSVGNGNSSLLRADIPLSSSLSDIGGLGIGMLIGSS